MNWVYVSPHFDDAVLGCGGTIARQVRRGDRVLVLTVHSGTGPGVRAVDEAFRSTRESENARAAERLGFRTAELGLVDAVWRRRHVDDPAARFFGPPSAQDRQEIREAVRRWAGAFGALDRVAVPLGVGGHVDHVSTFDALTAEFGLSRLVLYEERPYRWVDGAVERRWRDIGAGPCPPEGRQAGASTRVVGTRAMRRVRATIDDREFAQLLAGIGCYRSQLAHLFGARSPSEIARRHGARLRTETFWFPRGDYETPGAVSAATNSASSTS